MIAFGSCAWVRIAPADQTAADPPDPEPGEPAPPHDPCDEPDARSAADEGLARLLRHSSCEEATGRIVEAARTAPPCHGP
jgi:hypothetical protein